MTKDEFSLLFHRAQVNRVAFKRVLDCFPELQVMVEMAIKEEREACAKLLDDNWYKTQSDAADALRIRGEP